MHMACAVARPQEEQQTEQPAAAEESSGGGGGTAVEVTFLYKLTPGDDAGQGGGGRGCQVRKCTSLCYIPCIMGMPVSVAGICIGLIARIERPTCMIGEKLPWSEHFRTAIGAEVQGPLMDAFSDSIPLEFPPSALPTSRQPPYVVQAIKVCLTFVNAK